VNIRIPAIATVLILSTTLGVQADHHELGEPVTGVIQRQPTPAPEPTTTNYSNIGYQCTLNGLSRRILINHPNSPATLPCEVTYYKDNEAPNTAKVLWKANNDAGYCEQQAQFMANRLGGWGWQCDAL